MAGSLNMIQLILKEISILCQIIDLNMILLHLVYSHLFPQIPFNFHKFPNFEKSHKYFKYE